MEETKRRLSDEIMYEKIMYFDKWAPMIKDEILSDQEKRNKYDKYKHRKI